MIEKISKKSRKTEMQKNVSAPKEVLYPVHEIVNQYKAFGVSKEIAALALSSFEKESISEKEAKALIKKFKNMEVR